MIQSLPPFYLCDYIFPSLLIQSLLQSARQRNSAFMAASFQLAPRAVSTSTNRRGQGSSGMSMGLFGLGAPEIAVCLAVAALILGPDKLAGEWRTYF
ncbi:unnamed protein product [Choristocarpus tenellus]